jgi:hypothetical protein
MTIVYVELQTALHETGCVSDMSPVAPCWRTCHVLADVSSDGRMTMISEAECCGRKWSGSGKSRNSPGIFLDMLRTTCKHSLQPAFRLRLERGTPGCKRRQTGRQTCWANQCPLVANCAVPVFILGETEELYTYSMSVLSRSIDITAVTLAVPCSFPAYSSQVA